MHILCFWSSWWSMVKHLTWSLLGIAELDPLDSVDSASATLARLLFGAFLIMGVILLVNMMIALLSNTYQRVEVTLTAFVWSTDNTLVAKALDSHSTKIGSHHPTLFYSNAKTAIKRKQYVLRRSRALLVYYNRKRSASSKPVLRGRFCNCHARVIHSFIQLCLCNTLLHSISWGFVCHYFFGTVWIYFLLIIFFSICTLQLNAAALFLSIVES